MPLHQPIGIAVQPAQSSSALQHKNAHQAAEQGLLMHFAFACAHARAQVAEGQRLAQEWLYQHPGTAGAVFEAILPQAR